MRHTSFARRLACFALALAALNALSGCAEFGYRPVMPYERETLASPLMAVSRDPLSDKYLQHVFETREGARGATGASGGGCGCN
jgi:hypothetical protein